MKSNTIILLTSVPMATGTIVSAAIPCDQLWGYAVQAIWAGTPVGTLSLQASSESPPNQSQVSQGGMDNITIWDTIANSPVIIAGTSGSFMWNITTASYRYFRLVYTGTSGTGTLDAIASLKGL